MAAKMKELEIMSRKRRQAVVSTAGMAGGAIKSQIRKQAEAEDALDDFAVLAWELNRDPLRPNARLSASQTVRYDHFSRSCGYDAAALAAAATASSNDTTTLAADATASSASPQVPTPPPAGTAAGSGALAGASITGWEPGAGSLPLADADAVPQAGAGEVQQADGAAGSLQQAGAGVE